MDSRRVVKRVGEKVKMQNDPSKTDKMETEKGRHGE